jgi:hypothetical protein
MRALALTAIVAALGGTVAVVALHGGPSGARASSHREAPLIAEDPTADGTDAYAFRSPDKPNTVTLISNVIPGEDPAAGPNWYTFSPNARYDIYVDRNGDGSPTSAGTSLRCGKPTAFLGGTQQSYTSRRSSTASPPLSAKG